MNWPTVVFTFLIIGVIILMYRYVKKQFQEQDSAKKKADNDVKEIMHEMSKTPFPTNKRAKLAKFKQLMRKKEAQRNRQP